MNTKISSPVLSSELIATLCAAISDPHPKFKPIIDDKDHPADHTYVFMVTSQNGCKYVLIISNNQYPKMVRRAIDKIQEAKSILYGWPQNVVEMPILIGDLNNNSYGLWLFRNPISKNRYIRFVQKIVLGNKVKAWLETIAAQTRKNDLSQDTINNNFIEPINALLTISKLTHLLSNDCHIVLANISSGNFKPIHVLQHSDLWHGNILISNVFRLFNPSNNGFVIIDWAGSRISGYPFFDLITLSISLNNYPAKTTRYIESMMLIFKCSRADVLAYYLCALGKLYQELENFPEDRFVNLCENSLNHLTLAGIKNASA